MIEVSEAAGLVGANSSFTGSLCACAWVCADWLTISGPSPQSPSTSALIGWELSWIWSWCCSSQCRGWCQGGTFPLHRLLLGLHLCQRGERFGHDLEKCSCNETFEELDDDPPPASVQMVLIAWGAGATLVKKIHTVCENCENNKKRSVIWHVETRL